MIPKKIHQIWISKDPVPSFFQGYMRKLRDMHPAWEYRLWDLQDISPLLPRVALDAYAAGMHPALVSDIGRFAVLKEYGGIYLDADCEPVKPLDPLIGGDAAFFCGSVCSGNAGLIEMAVIGSAPGGKIVEALLEGLTKSLRTAGIKPFLGIREFNRLIYQTMDDSVRIYGCNYFHGWDWTNDMPLSPTPEEAYIIHHFARSWMTPGPQRSLKTPSPQPRQPVKKPIFSNRV